MGFFVISIMNFTKETNLKESGCEVEESECPGNTGVSCLHVGDGVHEDQVPRNHKGNQNSGSPGVQGYKSHMGIVYHDR